MVHRAFFRCCMNNMTAAWRFSVEFSVFSPGVTESRACRVVGVGTFTTAGGAPPTRQRASQAIRRDLTVKIKIWTLRIMYRFFLVYLYQVHVEIMFNSKWPTLVCWPRLCPSGKSRCIPYPSSYCRSSAWCEPSRSVTESFGFLMVGRGVVQILETGHIKSK